MSARAALAAGALAAPLFVVVALAQALTRDGFDLTRQPVSMLSNGDLGWIQISSFAVTGLLSIAAAYGLRGLTPWAPRLLVLIGAGLLIAAAFRLDSATTMSRQAIVHNVGGSLSFFSMIALCFVLARHFPPRWARTGRIAAIAFAALLLWAMTGGRAGALTLFVGVALAWGWISATSGILLRRTYGYRPGSALMPAAGAATKLDA
ncbi:DUF998 domain-containing protein [Dactylosporangium sp. CA-139066]|uniref:DUF998 domain-containing protein n=1 Tax=Dactylosporangium sp. CA-139066 TaxID=3239930 RepID=UPI003D8B62E2